MCKDHRRSSKSFVPKKHAMVVLGAAGAFLLFACSIRKPAVPPEKIVIAFSSPAYTVLAVVAQVKGYFREEGLMVTAHRHPFGKPALDEVISGTADVATVAETPFMFAVTNGEKVTVISTIQNDDRNHAIIAKRAGDISNPGDLRGKRIGTTSGTTADFFLDAFLAAHAVSRKEVTVIDLKPDNIEAALVAGQIDAASVFEPYSLRLKKKFGTDVMSFFDEDIYTLTFNIVAQQDFVRNNPGKVKKLLRALLRAEEYVKHNPATAQMIVAEFGGLNIELVQEGWGGAKYEVALDQSLLLALEDETMWAIKRRFTRIDSMPNYLNYIYLEGLAAVKPKAVRILR